MKGTLRDRYRVLFCREKLRNKQCFFSSLEGYDWLPFIGFLSWSSLLQPFRLYCICIELLYTEQNVVHIILLRLNSTKGICIITRSIIMNKSLARSSSVRQTRSFLFSSLWLKSLGVNLYLCPLFFFWNHFQVSKSFILDIYVFTIPTLLKISFTDIFFDSLL